MSFYSCCCKCQTLYRIDANGKVLWKANFFHDNVQTRGLTGSNMWTVGQCDVDQAGNVYQCGFQSQQVVPLVLGDQRPLMYTLRSWDFEGSLRWSWSEAPEGTISTSIFGTVRQGPRKLLGCRTVPGEVAEGAAAVIVGEQPLIAGDGSGRPTGVTHATAFDVDGNQVWRVGLVAGAKLVGCGATRSLWLVSDFSFPTSPVSWVLLSHVDGSITSTFSGIPVYIPPSYMNGMSVQLVTATIDVDDSIYAVLVTTPDSFSGGTTTYYFGVAKFAVDASEPAITMTSKNFYYRSRPFVATCERKLGIPTGIVLDENRVIVYSSKGVEEYSKSTLALQAPSFGLGTSCEGDPDCLPISKIFYADAAHIGMYDSQGNILFAPSIHNRDYTRWKYWNAQDSFKDIFYATQASTFQDARKLPDGGAIWSQNYGCSDHLLQEETRPTPIVPAADLCFPNCFHAPDFPSTITGPYGHVYPISDQFTKMNAATTAGDCKDGNALPGCRWYSNSFFFAGSAWGMTLLQDLTGTGATLNVAVFYGYEAGGPGPVYVQASYRTTNLTCAGGSFTFDTGSPGFPGSLDVVAMDCSTLADGLSDCGGFARFISVSDGSGGFIWQLEGPSTCSEDCRPVPPVVLPTALDQRTQVNCQ